MQVGHPQRLGGAFGLSVLAHALTALALLAAPARSPVVERPETSEIELEFDRVEPPAPVSPPEAPAAVAPVAPRPEPAPVAPRVSPSPGVVRGAAPTPAVVAEVVPVEVVPPQVEVAPTPRPETPEERQARLALLLDPSRVARSSFRVDVGAGPGQRTGPQGPETFAAPGVDARAIERDLTSWMRSQATAKAYLSRTRPQLRRQRDGTAVYTGHAFTATIREDGSVSFSDRPGVQTEGFSTSGSFDLGDVFMRASGQDPYAAEREWFMEQTEAERGRLEDAWRARSMASALAGIPAHCERIWGRAGTPPERRRRMLFELWDEAEAGERAADARRAIERWIREHLPDGSPDAFSAAELARWNGARESTAEFQPYR